MKNLLLSIVIMLLTKIIFANEWEQFQKNSEHHGRIAQEINGPYRVRWFWIGENKVLRNKSSNPAWNDDLNSKPGYSFPLPTQVNFTLSGNVQAIIKDSLVMFGTMNGDFYLLRVNDGTTVKKISLNAPIVASCAASQGIVVVNTLYGNVYGINYKNFNIVWNYQLPKVITIHPLIIGNNVYVGDHQGNVICLNLQTGALIWKTELYYPILGNLAGNDNYLIACTENMYVNVLSPTTGMIINKKRINGQSFRDTHPLIYNNKLFITAVPAPMFGSEYIMEEVMQNSSSFQDEENKIVQWLSGTSSYPNSSKDWKNKYIFQLPNLNELGVIASGPNDGCGAPPPSMVLDNQNRVLGWFKTKFPTLTNNKATFGTNFGLDIMEIDQTNGKRKQINLGQYAGMWQLETDNLYALSVTGNLLWMRQNFRGTQVINLSNANLTYVQVEAQVRDGGDNSIANIYYVNNETLIPHTDQTPWQGRVAPSFAYGLAFVVEHYGIVCIETKK